MESKQNYSSVPENGEIPLVSERGVDYGRLNDLLQDQDWEGANEETYGRMLEAVEQDFEQERSFIPPQKMKLFPCKDLKTIERLWVHYSDGKFGFTIQQQIWQECGSPNSAYAADWDKFCIRVGWKTPDASEYVLWNDLKFSKQNSPTGELPHAAKWENELLWRLSHLSERLKDCSL